MTSESPCLAVSQSPYLFYLGGIAAGAAIGWLAAKSHLGGWAPIGLFSLGVGVVLGLVLSKLASMVPILSAKQLVVGTILLALIAVFVEHTWLYHDFRRQWAEARANEPQVALFRPEEPWSPTEYLRHEVTAKRAALWCVDATLIVVSAVGVVLAQNSAKAAEFVVADNEKESLGLSLPTPDP